MTIMRMLLVGLLIAVPTLMAFQSDASKGSEPLSNTIKWRTSSEESNFGFNVYRSGSEEGPFKKLNDTPIEGGGTTDTPRNYQFEDTEIEPNKGYYYYVESISLEGVRERFTPVIYAKPKKK